MKRKDRPPASRQAFTSEMDELLYLRGKVLFWLWDRQEQRSCVHFARRLLPLAKGLARRNPKAIIVHESLSLCGEALGDLRLAIRHRKKEIELTERLYRELEHSDKSTKAYAMQGRTPDILADSHVALGVLYEMAGRKREADLAIKNAEDTCRKHGLPFRDGDIFQR